ncbi:MAG TPA: PIG-L family deacetylase [Acidimicrobiales bacterium]
MGTLVCFHAHPDDESISTAGVMGQAAAEGHQVVLVCATRGEVGEVDDDVLDEGESLGDRRVEETQASAALIGAGRVEFLGYRDSGMMGEPTNNDPECFWQADVEEAAERLAAILREVGCTVLTIYDDNGNYGHPDHIQVHRVGLRAAALAGVDRVFEATANRTWLRSLWMAARDDGLGLGLLLDEVDGAPDEAFLDQLGVTEDRITHGVDVRHHAELKRASMAAHASQIDEQSFFMSMPVDAFREAFGWEWFIEHGEIRSPDQPMKTSII